MILLYCTADEAHPRIVQKIIAVTNRPIVHALTEDEIIPLIQRERPQTVFLFMPGQDGARTAIATLLRQRYGSLRVCVVPSKDGTDQLADNWQKKLIEGLKPKRDNGSPSATWGA